MEYQASQCLSYALGKWKEEGGYLLLGSSVHWCIPHVLHMTNDGVISHYVPDKLLKAPWYSVFGFKGKVIEQDTTERGPMNMFCMLIGTLLLLVLGGLWVLKTLKDMAYDKISRKR